MAIYSTKTSKLNQKKKRLSVGTCLILFFATLLILVAFSFFDILTISMIGIFGLLFYPICVFMITIGVLICLNKPIRASKPLIVAIVIWFFFFVLLMQMITSDNIDAGFVEYTKSTFKYDVTAGGVIFGTLLYPLYFLTHTVATYILLIVALVVSTALLIDRVRIEFKLMKSKTIIDDSNAKDNNEILEEIDDEFADELALEGVKTHSPPPIDDDIFIQDEDDFLSETSNTPQRTIKDLESIVEASETEEDDDNNNFVFDGMKASHVEGKPSIIVHEEESFDSTANPTKSNIKIDNVVNNSQLEREEQERLKNEEKRKAALEFLNITQGNFQTKKMPKGIDNVLPQQFANLNTDSQSQNPTTTISQLAEQTSENESRLSSLTNLSEKLSAFESKKHQQDIYDENLTKQSFNNGTYSQSHQITIPDITSSSYSRPEKAQNVYNGNVNENIVAPQGPKVIQVPIEPVMPTRPKNIYKPPPTYVRPPIDLLSKYNVTIENDQQQMNEKAERIVETLSNFKINTTVIDAIKGPTFTRYELKMAPGISVSTISPRINDLSMALESSCRVQVPIPNKNAFGIEVPNKKRVTVGLRDIIESVNFQNSKSPLTIALGKDISNECKVACIDQMVHTLVAGSTCSGKSVCLHTMLVSLLYKASPDEVKLLLVDPKTVEFTMYNDLPHMLIPKAITECEKAISALSWLVDEMERRYVRLNSIKARNIEAYNNSSQVVSGELPKMFYIVMVFDEVGDYMAINKKEIEEKVVRLAAKSRAAGIHLILTTQRPTTDVITGTIKANLPSRIAFMVTSVVDSRTILESAGAEALLGMGDMLFSPKGSTDMERIQCAYVKDQELMDIVNYIKEHNTAEFDEEIYDQMFNKKEGFDPSNSAEEVFDPMLKDCLKLFIKSKRASASMLQSYFSIGYPRATKIVMQMEKQSFVSPGDAKGRRTLYITAQEFAERFGEEVDE